MSTLQRGLYWSTEGSKVFLRVLRDVPDTAFAQPSSLPGWTVGHLVAHVAYNASALSRLMYWARTGIETRMYPSVEARNAEIAAGATFEPQRLRTMVAESDAQLHREFAEQPEEAWQAEIVTAQGVPRKAEEIPWMRTRELWIHAVDLERLEFADFPADLIDALIADVAATRQQRGDGPALTIRATDREQEWHVELSGEQKSIVEATAADLCRWLTGRGDLAGGPDLGRWL